MDRQAAGFDRKAYRRALGNFATGVTVVTARKPGGHCVGITANSFNSVSLDPPLVLWSLDRSAFSLPSFEQAEYFVVNVLAADQVALSNRFAGRSTGDKFDGVNWREGPGGAPVLSGCAATFQCRKHFVHDGGDHVIFLGEVLDFSDYGRPGLVYHRGAYAVSERHPAADSSAARPPGASFNDHYLGSLLARALECFELQFLPVLARAGVDLAGWKVLCALGDRSRCLSTEEIARAAVVSDLAAARAIDVLAAAGLVGVMQHEGGVDLMKLTERGEARLVPLLAAAAAYEADVLGALSALDARRLKELLKALPLPIQASRQSGAFLIDNGGG